MSADPVSPAAARQLCLVWEIALGSMGIGLGSMEVDQVSRGTGRIHCRPNVAITCRTGSPIVATGKTTASIIAATGKTIASITATTAATIGTIATTTSTATIPTGITAAGMEEEAGGVTCGATTPR